MQDTPTPLNMKHPRYNEAMELADWRIAHLVELYQTWLKAHPDADSQQRDASVMRYAAYVGSKMSFFRRSYLAIKLMKRTDLGDTLE
ncbi:hypothetical protein [Bradyrhizobium jicamae]|uniref:hypothetical protein n=1 Tax=Bradyrhizobium jicamae TaxID=280332 RepID=UPI001BABC827|nr:hypothetical protein [Bradyrhizobium jicamae]MBR0934865.1 hypothetical protein [Bradyrhizobium jicamae]